ncbi:hypothetical protein C0J52_25702 [Blattella germanica]|nr:hypothetical protein C0J52_25702 [Blattella germanica]
MRKPETVPQASIDMNKVLEVTDGEEVTGHAFSLAITAPDRVHFVKGTCREECRWWGDVLSVFPRSKGRHKRNATFPGGQATSILQQPPIRAATPNEPRPRFNSCHTEPSSLRHSPAPTWLPVEAEAFPTRDVTTPTESSPPPAEIPASASVPVDTRKATSVRLICSSGSVTSWFEYSMGDMRPALKDAEDVAQYLQNASTKDVTYRDQPASSASPPTRDKIQSDEKVRTRRVANREKRGVKTGRSFSEDFSGMLPTWRDRSKTESPTTSVRLICSSGSVTSWFEYSMGDMRPALKDAEDVAQYLQNASTKDVTYRDQPASSASPPTRDKIQSDEKVRTRRVANREKRGVKTGRSFSEDFSGMLPTWRDRSKTESPKPYLAPGEDGEDVPPPTTLLAAGAFDEVDAIGCRDGEAEGMARHFFAVRHLQHLVHYSLMCKEDILEQFLHICALV